MKRIALSRVLRDALIGLTMAASIDVALADIKDYEFQLVDPVVAVGPDATITVRLTNIATGKPVTDAVIFTTRLDMAPDGMEEMKTPVAAVPATEPGTYRFKAKISMAGGWRLTLGAKVQGETGVLEGRLVVRAAK